MGDRKLELAEEPSKETAGGQDRLTGTLAMTENKKRIPEKEENKHLTDEQLAEVSGGESVVVAHPTGFKRCAADPTHVYVEIHDACPICGSREFTRA